MSCEVKENFKKYLYDILSCEKHHLTGVIFKKIKKCIKTIDFRLKFNSFKFKIR